MTMSCYFLPPFPTLCVKVLLTLHLLDAPFSGKLRFTSCFSSDLVNKNIEYWMNEWKMRLFARLRQRERYRSLRYRPCDATAGKKNNLRMKETHLKNGCLDLMVELDAEKGGSKWLQFILSGTKICANPPTSRHWDVLQEKWKLWPAGGKRGLKNKQTLMNTDDEHCQKFRKWHSGPFISG